jgi:hypothetical protein
MGGIYQVAVKSTLPQQLIRYDGTAKISESESDSQASEVRRSTRTKAAQCCDLNQT